MNTVEKNYQELQQSLGLPHVPIFFTYFAPYPEYLDYITQQIVTNTNDARFIALAQELSIEIARLLNESFPKGGVLSDWLARVKNSPSYYNFKKDNRHIHSVNAKLAYIFIALREAIKGWGIAAEKLPDKTQHVQKVVVEEPFIYESIEPVTSPILHPAEKMDRSDKGIEIDLLPHYLELCRNEYGTILKSELFLSIRVQTEKTMLNTLTLFPHLITSPIDVMYKLIGKYPNHPDFLYQLSEHFPTYAVQRMLFSAYLLD